MDKFYKVFKVQPVVLPVVHVVNKEQTIKNITTAQEGQSDGVFLINHEISGARLFEIYESIINMFPNFWIGINCLGLKPVEVFNEVFRRGLFNLSGLWVDNAMINEYSTEQPDAESINKLRQESAWNGLYFGGVAFKYQRPVHEPEKAAKNAIKYMDVITTSGAGTGQPAETEKICKMRLAIGNKPLAIASGITTENIQNYCGIADCFLVATGISSNFVTLDLQKVKTLVDTVKHRI